MNVSDKPSFFALIADVYAFWKSDFSEFAGRAWWEAMLPYDFEAVKDAFNRHAVNPDSGQYLPKPADVVKMLGGSTQDAALVAWSKVDRAVREVGTYRSVVFDDPIIHRVVTDMGGWVLIGRKDNDEWPFVRNEFVNRYRGYRMRSEIPEYVPVLIGIAEAANNEALLNSQPPVLIGEARAAYAVMTGGGNKPLIEVTQVRQQVALLPGARGAA
ncbi:DUF6475 domain-containing protein [Paraburkholderia nemoris]|uniref:DUF6475 domain-containing protein n=1 Tax=Paraburkholderia nemoris TaxID=2793076 RepID=UPI001B1C61B6|nr:DUF6475 domain-containing protein [Paraburkholderia nemoris]CAE6838872.1 hypothetical protein R75777_06970 [Paraburkholderia nemoris]